MVDYQWISVTNKKDNSLKVIYTENVRLLFNEHRDSNIVSSVGWRAIQTEKCSDGWTSSNEVIVKSTFALNGMLLPKFELYIRIEYGHIVTIDVGMISRRIHSLLIHQFLASSPCALS